MARPHYPDDWFIAWHSPAGKRRLDERVRDRVPALSKERVKDAFAAGRITLSGKAATPAETGAGRVEVSVTQDDAGAWGASSGARGSEGYFLLYRDEDMLVVDKAAGLLSVPTDEGGEDSLLELLPSVVKGEVLPVHRIDRFTSGVLCFARNADARHRMIGQFGRHSITRRYVAITYGVPRPAKGTYRSYLASDARRVQRSVGKDHPEGELAITHYEVIEDLGEAAVVAVTLETGKRNQIRVHFAEAGYPLVGEHRYGVSGDWERGKKKDPRDLGVKRQALHAAELELEHPKHGKPVSAASPLPDDLRKFIERARKKR